MSGTVLAVEDGGCSCPHEALSLIRKKKMYCLLNTTQVCQGQGTVVSRETQSPGPTELIGNYSVTLPSFVRENYSVWCGILTIPGLEKHLQD